MRAKNADAIAALRAIKTTGPACAHRGLTLEEGLEIIRARRRGALLKQLSVAIGKPSDSGGSLLAAMGSWALRFAHLPEDGGDR